jgi:phosphonate transport system substrate-binding protein
MPYNFTVSPDFTPDHLSGWFIFNTWIQKQLGEGFHLELYNDFDSQRKAIEEGKVDLIFANPYDAAMLVREKGFSALVKPASKSDEAIIAVNAESSINNVEELQPGIKLASTDDPDVHMMGMIMLEPADLDKTNVDMKSCDSYVLVAKELLRGDSDIGFFLAEAFNDLSSMVRKQLKPLVSSQIQVVHHSLMIGPALADKKDDFRQALLSMSEDEKGQGVLKSLGFSGFEEMDEEEMEFMIDLVDTLLF